MANETLPSQRIRLMQYFILRPEGNFQEDIARDLNLQQGDIRGALESLMKSRYIQHSTPPTPAVRKTVYWKINPPTLYDLFVDPEFKDLQKTIQQQNWIIQIILKKFPGFPDPMVTIIPRMLQSSLTFFDYIFRYDTLDKFKEHFHPYFQINQFLTGFDRSFADYWVIYQVFAECCIKDNLVPNDILDDMVEALIKNSPASRQKDNIKYLQVSVHAIELTFPYWDTENKSIKESTCRNISEFRALCEEAKLLPLEVDPDRAEYTGAFYNILHNLAMDQYGDTLDPT